MTGVSERWSGTAFGWDMASGRKANVASCAAEVSLVKAIAVPETHDAHYFMAQNGWRCESEIR